MTAGLVALVVGLVALGVITAVRRSGRAGAVAEAARTRNPESPWLWREDWAAGRIQDGNRGAMIGAWVFAGFWNLVSLPSAVVGVRQALREQTWGLLIVLIFPAVGLGLLVWAVRATLRYRRFGVSRLELSTVPAPVGRELRGTVVAPGVLEAREGLRVTLTCVRRVTTGAGKSRSTSERVLWQEEQRLSGARTRTAEGMRTSVPVAFRLPADAHPSDGSNPRDRVIWRLAVAAEVPGVDYASSFEVPVFRTAESETGSAPDPSAPTALEPYVQPATSRVRVTRNRRGTEIDFPAGRNPLEAAGLTAFTAIWLAAVWATVHFGAPLLLQAVFAGFGLLLAWAALGTWLWASRVVVGDGGVIVSRGVLAPMREQRLDAGEIAEVTTRIGMQSGGTPFYDLVLVRKDGDEVPAGRGIRDKREAEWLADTVRRALKG